MENRDIRSDVIDIINAFSKEAIPAESIKSLANELGFESVKMSLENMEKVQKLNTIDASSIPNEWDTELAKAALLKTVKGKMILSMVEKSDNDLYTKIRAKTEELNELSLNAVKQYEKDIDLVLTNLKSMYAMSDKGTQIIDDILKTKLEVF